MYGGHHVGTENHVVFGDRMQRLGQMNMIQTYHSVDAVSCLMCCTTNHIIRHDNLHPENSQYNLTHRIRSARLPQCPSIYGGRQG